MHWLLDPLQSHYADFEGRIGRQEFWMFVLFIFGIDVVLGALHLGAIGGLVVLGLLVPSLGMGARRLHDTGRSGWLQLIGLIPVIGAIVLIIWCAEETKPADNEYGAPAKPKSVPSVSSTATTAQHTPQATDTHQQPPVV